MKRSVEDLEAPSVEKSTTSTTTTTSKPKNSDKSTSDRPNKQARKQTTNATPKDAIGVYFSQLSTEYDSYIDRRERLIKLCRDITRNSKQSISTLQRCKGNDADNAIYEIANSKLKAARDDLKLVYDEIKDQDYWRFQRNFSGGVQEFIEAFTFLHYLKHSSLISMEDCAKEMLIGEEKFPLCLEDYLGGVADLTGEVMRQCVSRAGAGDTAAAERACVFVREVDRCFRRALTSGASRSRDYEKKLTVMQQSLQKMEKICFECHLRKNEQFPSQQLRDNDDDDNNN